MIQVNFIPQLGLKGAPYSGSSCVLTGDGAHVITHVGSVHLPTSKDSPVLDHVFLALPRMGGKSNVLARCCSFFTYYV